MQVLIKNLGKVLKREIMNAEQKNYFHQAAVKSLLLAVLLISFVSESIAAPFSPLLEKLKQGSYGVGSKFVNNIGFSGTDKPKREDNDSGISRTREAKDELRVLFIGNSFTYTNDLPAIVASLAEATGQKQFAYKSIAFPDFSLEDHWQQGEARKAIASKAWDFVVMQQGPSALPESRTLLLEYARRFDAEIRRAGAKPAFYMVWPSYPRFSDFDRVSESYRLAADEIKSALFPAGEAWRAAWRRDAKLKLYSPDGLHPSQAGSYLNALVIYEQLYGKSPVGLPARLQIRSKTISKIELSEETAMLLQQAAAEANAKFRKN